MASCRLSSEIEGAKNRLSPLQQKSRIPVRIVNHLNNNSGKSSSSKDEVNIKQRILKNRLEKSQNKPPSRIPVPISRTNSKDVGRDKIPKTVMITVTGKKPLGTITGIVDICIVFKAFSLRCGKSSSRELDFGRKNLGPGSSPLGFTEALYFLFRNVFSPLTFDELSLRFLQLKTEG